MSKEKKVLTPEEQAVVALKKLQKKAKKLKVDFDKYTTVQELEIMVSAAEQAKAAQEASKAELPPTPPVSESAPAPFKSGDQVHADEAKAMSMAGGAVAPVTPEGDTVVLTHTTKQKELYKLVTTPAGECVAKNRFGVVVAEFGNKENSISEGKRYMENLSRF